MQATDKCGGTFNPSVQWAEAEKPLCVENSLVYIVRFVSQQTNQSTNQHMTYKKNQVN